MQIKSMIKTEQLPHQLPAETDKSFCSIDTAIKNAWKMITPWWSLKNLIAVNPLQGLENLPFEEAILVAKAYFQNTETQLMMAEVNRETIKWSQALFDDGQATIHIPEKTTGAYKAWRDVIIYDEKLHHHNREKMHCLRLIPQQPEAAIAYCLEKLNVNKDETVKFLTLMLTTLPGWASYIKYQTEWTQGSTKLHQMSQNEYLAMRVIITSLLLPNAAEIIHKLTLGTTAQHDIASNLANTEDKYRNSLLTQLVDKPHDINAYQTPEAQLVFCIDVRSEPMRRAIEAQGNYETFGFAGFFGIPAIIEHSTTGEEHAFCPVLIPPKHKVKHCHRAADTHHKRKSSYLTQLKLYQRIYQSLKYTFTTPFVLVEALGPWSGLWMTLRTLFPSALSKIKTKLSDRFNEHLTVEFDIPFSEQLDYANSALKMMGLTSRFSPLVVLCGHGSATENNAYASALDCGACGGRDGAANAKILAQILNNPLIRQELAKNGISIPDETLFIAALHNTTTDEVITFTHTAEDNERLSKLKHDLKQARDLNCKLRHDNLSNESAPNSSAECFRRSADWSEIRPEWGLARNASFIIAPRSKSKNLNLDGRAFLHSYDWQQDLDGKSLTTILTAPMIVAQWINCQYLFSTIDNVAYGSGSKITHNITGKIGIMQGNASDLMHGLSLQSVKLNDETVYHEPQRLLTIIYSPRFMVSKIIDEQAVLKTLFGNGWVNVTCIDPTDNNAYDLQRNLSWTKRPHE